MRPQILASPGKMQYLFSHSFEAVVAPPAWCRVYGHHKKAVLAWVAHLGEQEKVASFFSWQEFVHSCLVLILAHCHYQDQDAASCHNLQSASSSQDYCKFR